MATNLSLTDGTTTINLNQSGGSYELADAGWVPQVAETRLDDLGGRGPVEDAIEEIPIYMFGATKGTLQANIRALQVLLTKAVRAYEYGEGAQVYLTYRPDGSSLSADVAAPVYGAPGEGERTLEYTRPYAAAGRGYMCEARVRIRRGGLWVSTTADTPASSAAVQSPNVMTVTLADHDTLSPCVLTLGASGGDGWGTGLSDHGAPAGRLILTDNANKILILEGEAGSTGAFTPDTSAATLARKPRGGAVARYSGATPAELFFTIPSSFGTLAKRVRVFMCVRNGPTSIAWNVTTRLATAAMSVYARPATITANMTYPEWFDLGTLTLPDDVTSAPPRIAHITFQGASAGAYTYLDVDSIVLVALDEHTTILSHDAATIEDGGGYTANALRLRVDPSYLTRPTPLVAAERFTPSTVTSGIGSRGDALILSKGTTIAAVYLTTGSNDMNTPDFFRQVDRTGATVLSHTLTVTRSRAYVAVP